MRSLFCCLLLFVSLSSVSNAAEAEKYLLAAKLPEGDTSSVKVTLEVGGDLLDRDGNGEKKYPLSVTGELGYLERMLGWSNDATQAVRSVRQYETATAKIQIDKGGLVRELPAAKQTVVAELRAGRSALASTEQPLTRDQYDLLNVVGNSLALNRLLPGRELAEGESWQHESDAISALLGMDHVAVCEVQSVVTGSKHSQVQIRLAGTVHGTIDGAPSEMELRGAYLFHQKRHRITKFSLAIKEKRTASQVVPGLDVVAKVLVIVAPTKQTIAKDVSDQFADSTQPLTDTLSFESPERGYQFLHDPAWYVIAEQSDLVSFHSLQEGNPTAHCNATTLPARSEGRGATLEEFEHDVRESLGKSLKTVVASTEWTTSQGHHCLGVVAQGFVAGKGQVKDVPIEWRYYLIASPDRPRVSLVFTLEQSQAELFNDADRQIVDTLELLEKPPIATATKPTKQVAQ